MRWWWQRGLRYAPGFPDSAPLWTPPAGPWQDVELPGAPPAGYVSFRLSDQVTWTLAGWSWRYALRHPLSALAFSLPQALERAWKRRTESR